MPTTLFAHLALKFGSHPENLATEALAFLLQGSTAASDGLRQLLASFSITLPAGVVWSTQVSHEGARPDLVARTPDGTALAIEAKFWAGFTPNQPVQYLAQLPIGAALVFVVPHRRRELVWHELMSRVRNANRQITDLRDNPKRAVLDGKTLALIDWRELCAALQARCDAESDVSAARGVAELLGLCTQMDSEAFLPMTSDELTSTMYRRVAQFGQIVDEVVEKLKADNLVATEGLRSAAVNGRYGRYVRLAGVQAQIMCDVWKWTTYASTPLWLTVYGKTFGAESAPAAFEALRPLEHENPPRMFRARDGFPTVPLMVQAGVERVAVVAEAVRQAKEVAALIAHLANHGGLSDAPILDGP